MGIAPLHHSQLTRFNDTNIRLAVVGPMLGGHAGHVPLAGEALASRLAGQGYPVVITSDRLQRVVRLADITGTLIRHGARVDVQILQVYGGASFVVEDLASAIGSMFGQKIIMHVHGGAMPAFIAKYPEWSRRVLSRAAAVVVPSGFLRGALASIHRDVRVIPNAIDLSSYPYRHRRTVRPRLFWMRTFHDVYNPELAVRVFARVKRVYPDATLVMAGQDKGTQAIVQRVASLLGVHHGLRFPGCLGPDAKARESDAADIFLNTNRIDNAPVSVIEACAWGLPVVATRVGGIADLLTDDETGLLVPDDDADAMTAAVCRLLREPGLAGRLSSSARALAQRCSWDIATAQWERLLHGVAAS